MRETKKVSMRSLITPCPERQKPCYAEIEAGGKMSDPAIEKLIANAIHTAFIKYPEGDGGPNLDYEWIPPEQSSHITKAILLDLAAGGFQIVKKA
jgi:hypothetical protein